jgi:crossover junction endodeoxyribonuclease RuvC
MRILGIDCGSERTGWGVIESDGRHHQVLGHGVIRVPAKDPFDHRLAEIGTQLRRLLVEFAPEVAAVEEVFAAKNVASALKLAHVRGVALMAIAEAKVRLGEYSALEVKSSVVGYGRAEKAQVQLMVRTLTGVTVDAEDAADALAVAICHATRTGCRPVLAVNAVKPAPKRDMKPIAAKLGQSAKGSA